MMTPDLTEEDIRVLQYVADRGDAGITTDRAVLRYRALALQLPICFKVRALSGGLVSSTPE